MVCRASNPDSLRSETVDLPPWQACSNYLLQAGPYCPTHAAVDLMCTTFFVAPQSSMSVCLCILTLFGASRGMYLVPNQQSHGLGTCNGANSYQKNRNYETTILGQVARSSSKGSGQTGLSLSFPASSISTTALQDRTLLACPPPTDDTCHERGTPLFAEHPKLMMRSITHPTTFFVKKGKRNRTNIPIITC